MTGDSEYLAHDATKLTTLAHKTRAARSSRTAPLVETDVLDYIPSMLVTMPPALAAALKFAEALATSATM